jgi:streptomycin 6-kinase
VRDIPATDFAALGSPDGRAWMAALPSLVSDLARQWGLTVSGESFRHGYTAVVLAVEQRGRPLALKLAWPREQVAGEADALVAWQARGMVELVTADRPRGALLLERLDASRSLADLPLTEAAAIAGALMQTLAIEAPGSFPSLQAVAARLADQIPERQRALGDPVPRQWVGLAASLAAGLAREPGRSLVHTDLHYDNVLASERPGRPWVAIDPSAAAGNPERSVAELLWTRADELSGSPAIVGLLDTITENGQLDRARAVAWAFVRCIDYWLWGVEKGLTVGSAAVPTRGQRAGPGHAGPMRSHLLPAMSVNTATRP